MIYDEISNKLKVSGYKLTPQREVTVKTLIELREELLTPEEVFMAVKNRNSSIGLATVYRTLDLLDELNIIKKVQFHDGLTRYDLVPPSNSSPSCFLVCTNCGTVQEIKEEIFNTYQMQVQKKYEFQIKTQDITYHGICKECQ